VRRAGAGGSRNPIQGRKRYPQTHEPHQSKGVAACHWTWPEAIVEGHPAAFDALPEMTLDHPRHQLVGESAETNVVRRDGSNRAVAQ